MKFGGSVYVRDGYGPVLKLTLEEDMLTIEVVNRLLGVATVELQAFKDMLAELEA
jgi:hypothetical protein